MDDFSSIPERFGIFPDFLFLFSGIPDGQHLCISTKFAMMQSPNTVDDYFQQQIAQKIFESKIEARLVSAKVSTWLSEIGVHFATVMAAKFGRYQF